jgi:cytochrome c-type biogenesis protein CcmF
VAACFAILWGTLFPVISEAVTGEKISVGAPFFNRINIPIGLFLLFLTGVGPLFAWRRTSLDSLRRNFQWPLLAALVLVAALVAAGVRHFYALMSFGLCIFVAWTIFTEFYKGAHAISTKAGRSLLVGAVELTRRNTRRYGGYIVHLGIVVMFIGFTGAAFDKDTTVEVNKGDIINIGHYQLRVAELSDGDNDNYTWNRARINVSKNGEQLGTLEPERRFFKVSKQGTSEVAIRRRPNEDLYLNFAGMSQDGQRAVIQAYVNPLVSCIWSGYWVLLLGTLICMVPPKVRLQYARTQVLGVKKANAPVEK